MFFICIHGKEKHEIFMVYFNKFTLNLKLIYVTGENITFLYLNITLFKGKLITDLQIKFKDFHQYLHCSLSHPEHTKRFIVYSQT